MATSWPVLVEHASSEAAGVAIVSIWASMARASMCGRPCEEREARSEAAGHLLSKRAALPCAVMVMFGVHVGGKV